MIEHDGPVMVDCRVSKDANCFPMIPSRRGAYRNAALRRQVDGTHGRRSQGTGVRTVRHENPASRQPSATCSPSLVDNEPGILAKIAGLFTARGYNIDSLTVADITEDHAISRITIVTNGPPQVIDQIMAQLERLVPVHKVTDLTEDGPHVERELALVKVAGTGENRVEALRIADVFRAKVVDTTTESFVFELTGATDKIDSFIALMRELGLVEVGRTGIVGMMRGAEGA